MPSNNTTFSDVLLAARSAVEARRRRGRIERLLGYLPVPPESLPATGEADPSGDQAANAAAVAPTVVALHEEQIATEKARAALVEARRKEKAGHHDRTHSADKQALTITYLEAAKTWHAGAVAYRDAQLPATRDTTARTPEQEQAEAILLAATQTLSEAASEGRREKTTGDQQGGAPAASGDSLRRAFGLVLACEGEVHEKILQAGTDDGQAALCLAQYRLARAEKKLFEAASETLTEAADREECKAAADALEVEVQRRLREWNEARARRSPPAPPPPAPPPPHAGAPAAAGDPFVDLQRAAALRQDQVGLAFSGGGIRSATFGLGVLQGLAQLRLLGMFDYLSTVSGGGYIGAWFAAWVRRENSLTNVEKQLNPGRVTQAEADRYGEGSPPAPLGPRPRDPEPEPVHHLRAYSRYLAPQDGPFSPDTWTMLTVYVRNLFINSLFLLPLAFAAVFFWRSLMAANAVDVGPDLDLASAGSWPASLRFWLTLGFVTALLIAAGSLVWQQENLYEADQGLWPPGERTPENASSVYRLILLLLLMAMLGPVIFSLDPVANAGRAYDQSSGMRYLGQRELVDWLKPYRTWEQFALAFLCLALIPVLVVRVFRWLRRLRRGDPAWSFNWAGAVGNLVMALGLGAFVYLALSLVIWPYSFVVSADPRFRCLLHAFGVPLVFAAMVGGGFLEMAVVGRKLSEHEREWRSRVAACLLMAAGAWLIFATGVLFLPWAGARLFAYLREGEPGSTLWEKFAKGLLAAAWGAVSGGGAWVAMRSNVSQRSAPLWQRALMAVAPPVFLLGLLAGVSVLAQDAVEGAFGPPRSASRGDFLHRVSVSLGWDLFLVVVALGLAFAFGWLIRVNRFSMHMFYANRLTRGYLGASRRKPGLGAGGTRTGVDPAQPVRQKNDFTGFDPGDDMPLADLCVVGPAGERPYPGPLLLVNCALNCLAGDELAYQDRGADGFVFAPDFTGGRLTGRTPTPGRPGGDRNLNRTLTLGRVMAISGAAVDPNMGGLSRPLTALMTLFNTRLGWWLENPREDLRPSGRPWLASEPGFNWPMWQEFVGQTNEDSQFIHISDGGHFENLGVYELLNRRCRFIVAVDVGTDRVAASDNMAAMLRLARTDFGVRVELDPSKLQMAGASDYSPWHCCIGRIRYDEVDEGGVPGLMVYLQGSLSGDEPPDVLQYASRHSTFPRQSTVNQFFDEAQFEAYRALGHHVALQVFGEAAPRWSGAAHLHTPHQEKVRAVFSRLREQWFPPLECASSEWVAASAASLDLERHRDGRRDLAGFSHSLYPEVAGGAPPVPPGAPPVVWPVASPHDPLAECRAISQTLQVMELAWAAMKLHSFHAHPTNRGWMNTFRRWTASEQFHRYWPFLRAEYSRAFVQFCEDVLNLQPPADRPLVAVVAGATPPELAPLEQQFAWEWNDLFDRLRLPSAAFPRTGLLADFLGSAVAGPNGSPLAWLTGQGTVGGVPFATGLVGAARTARLGLFHPGGVPADMAEFFIYLRGAYRAIGAGPAAAREALRLIDQQAPFLPPANPLRRLCTFSPMREETAGGRLELERWMDFHYDLGFRRVRRRRAGPASHFVVLERSVP